MNPNMKGGRMASDVITPLRALLGDTLYLSSRDHGSGEYLNGVAVARDLIETRISVTLGENYTPKTTTGGSWELAQGSPAKDPVCRVLDNVLTDLEALRRQVDDTETRRGVRHVLDAASDLLLNRLDQLK